jgi:hypothetical protein
MLHDALCELGQPNRNCRTCDGWVSPGHPHCHCGSRAFPLCSGCRGGLHRHHLETNPATGKRCSCDLCNEEAA